MNGVTQPPGENLFFFKCNSLQNLIRINPIVNNKNAELSKKLQQTRGKPMSSLLYEVKIWKNLFALIFT